MQAALRHLFEQQYELILEEEVEIRTRTETRIGTQTHTDPETGETWEEEYEYEVEVEYEYYILNVTLRNYGLGNVIRSVGLTEDQMERYELLLKRWEIALTCLAMIFLQHLAVAENTRIMIFQGSSDRHGICQYDTGSRKVSGVSVCLGRFFPIHQF